MTINCLARVGHAFGKGEVVSSILTGSTTSSGKLLKPATKWGKPDITRTTP